MNQIKPIKITLVQKDTLDGRERVQRVYNRLIETAINKLGSYPNNSGNGTDVDKGIVRIVINSIK